MKLYKKKIICFDIDNVICNTKKNYYRASKPNGKIIKVINELYDEGHFIKIFTSRYMGRSGENIAKASKRARGITIKQLRDWNVKYHKLIFGKPSYDVFIDDKAINFDKLWFKKLIKVISK